MTVTEWYSQQPEEKKARARLLLQVTCAHFRSACGDGRWPSFETALKELDNTTMVTAGRQWEVWRDRSTANVPGLKALDWNVTRVIAAWRNGEL